MKSVLPSVLTVLDPWGGTVRVRVLKHGGRTVRVWVNRGVVRLGLGNSG